ncbi:30S ribosomal protein S17 [Aquihabitans sp. G128]|uniref:30S ribosomal protein S17 n=1 Tax=Aquihabitans sp. G128 TaxID=2849779 RepID=UPI001C248517|nr:30S ribosomal protein S17 [Aquihabitans sp. G128]QXC60315.1 30S ribosomal protein S17 [Aquihabitans sp. G128]
MAEETTETRENARKVREGLVTSSGMDKTAVVTVSTRKPHPRYKKSMARSTKLYVHDEENTLNVGDRVKVGETRPLSKLKRWRILEILERAK